MHKSTKPNAVICDLDGTLADLNGRLPYGEAQADCVNDLLHTNIAEVMKANHQNGLFVILVSGRFEKYTSETIFWLNKHNIPYDALFLRKDDDMRPDEVIKSEIYVEEIEPYYDVIAAYDDRPKIIKMLREKHGLNVVDVGFGIDF